MQQLLRSRPARRDAPAAWFGRPSISTRRTPTPPARSASWPGH